MKIKQKNILLIIGIIFVLAITIVAFIILKNNGIKINIQKKGDYTENINEASWENEYVDINNVRTVNKTNNTFTKIKKWDSLLDATTCINYYNNAIKELYYEKNGTKLDDVTVSNPSSQIISCLDKNYVQKKGLKQDDLEGVEFGNFQFIPTSAYYSIQENYNLIVYGYLINKESNTTEEYGYLVEMSYKNKSFAILPYDELKDKNLLNIGLNKTIEIEAYEIEKNDYNILSPIVADDSNIAEFLLNQFKNNALYKPEIAFEQLDSDYASKFGDAKKFKQYVEKNKNKIESISISNLELVNQNNGNVLYKCYDSEGEPFYIQYSSSDFFKILFKFSNITI